MDIPALVTALAPAFAAGFALQRLLEILDPIVDRISKRDNKKILLGLTSLLSGLGLAAWPTMRVLSHLVTPEGSISTVLDYFVTSLIISGGTEGFNSILKFVNYKKEAAQASALSETIKSSNATSRMGVDNGMDDNNGPSTSNECIDWRMGEFRQRVRSAVAAWAEEPVESILPTATLGELAKRTPWNIGQQARLVQTVNANQAFAPPFPNTQMRPPSQLLPSATTVEEFESVAWRHQDPITVCLAFTN